MTATTKYVWYVYATDIHEKTIFILNKDKEGEEKYREEIIDVFHVEKKFFDTEIEALQFIVDHRKKYKETTPKKYSKAYEMYNLVQIDTEMVPEYKILYTECERKEVN